MLKRWGILLAMLTLMAGVTLAASGASAATIGFRPGGPIHLAEASSHLHRGVSHQAGRRISHQAESTNWSGYAATTGTYTSGGGGPYLTFTGGMKHGQSVAILLDFTYPPSLSLDGIRKALNLLITTP